MLTLSIQRALKNSCLHPDLYEVMEYAVFPAGKLFRPRLVEAIALDLSQSMTQDHYHLAAAIELHHAYTLVHDDLPSMDNDLMRRGRPATHAHYGEWKAILAGDALLIASFNEVAKIKHSSFHEILKLMSWSTGAKGLIQGQFLDLGASGTLNIQEVMRIHELKTGRLIQLATMGAYLLSKDSHFKGKVEFMRLGRDIGISFQLLDDLSELTASEVSLHEKKINPFIQDGTRAIHELSESYLRLQKILLKHQLFHVEKMLKSYFLHNQQQLLKDFSHIKKNVNGEFKDLERWITSFV
jgi:geranylgeranyl pyrophosphate synthase